MSAVAVAGWRTWGYGLVRGSSQIFFQTNLVAGLLVLAAFVVADWRMAVLALLGALGGMLGGRLVGYKRGDIITGMQSYTEIDPEISIGKICDCYPFQRAADRERLSEGLRKAGLPQ